MELEVGKFYIDNEEIVYRCVAVATAERGYTEAVMRLEGYTSGSYIFAVFYRSHYAFLDRENPDFRLVEEVEYYPHSVRESHDG